MKKVVGLWIDYQKAIIVTIENEAEVTREIRSNVEKHIRLSSDTHAKAPDKAQGLSAKDMGDRQFGNHLGRYYEAIISFIRDASSIWILGPGEAKTDLENCLKREDLGGRIVGIETVDKLTDHQITAKVQDYFQPWQNDS